MRPDHQDTRSIFQRRKPQHSVPIAKLLKQKEIKPSNQAGSSQDEANFELFVHYNLIKNFLDKTHAS